MREILISVACRQKNAFLMLQQKDMVLFGLSSKGADAFSDIHLLELPALAHGQGSDAKCGPIAACPGT